MTQLDVVIGEKGCALLVLSCQILTLPLREIGMLSWHKHAHTHGQSLIAPAITLIS